MSRRSEFEDAIDAEVAEWPGATVNIEDGGKHPVAVISFDGLKQRVSFSGTPSDGRFGKHRMLGDMRRALKAMGATRPKPEADGDDVKLEYRKPVDLSKKPGKADLVATEPVDRSDPRDVLATLIPPTEEATLPPPDIAPGKEAPAPRAPRNAASVVKGMADAVKAIMDQVNAIDDGIYFGLPDTVYHAVPRLSSSALQKLIISPATFWRGSWLDPDRPEPDEEQTKAQKIGKAYHCARLEPDEFLTRYAREPSKDDVEGDAVWNGTEIGDALFELGQAKKKAGESVVEQGERLERAGYDGTIWPLVMARFNDQLEDRIALPAKVFDEIEVDGERLARCGDVARLLRDGAAEVSIFWTDANGLKMKARTDYLTPEHWADLKTFDNSKGNVLNEALANAVRFNRLYIQAVTYRDAVEAIRTGGLQIKGEATDQQRKVIAAIQIAPTELACWFVFQEKGGIPNLLGREFEFYDVPLSVRAQHAGATADQIDAVNNATRRPTMIHQKAKAEIFKAKRNFDLYAQVYDPGEPWHPLEPLGTIGDADFSSFWLEN